MTEMLYKVPEYGKEIELKAVKSGEGVVRMNTNDMKKLDVAEGDEIDLIGPRTRTVRVFGGSDSGIIEVPEEILSDIGVKEGVVLSVRKKYEEE